MEPFLSFSLAHCLSKAPCQLLLLASPPSHERHEDSLTQAANGVGEVKRSQR